MIKVTVFFNEHNSSEKILPYYDNQTSYSFTLDTTDVPEIDRLNTAVLVSGSDNRQYRFLTTNTNSAINVIHPDSKIENDLKKPPKLHRH